MNPLPGCGLFRDLYYCQNPHDAEAVLFLPVAPGPERDAQGRPTLLLVAAGPSGLLQLGVRWTAETKVLEALRRHAAKELHMAAALLRLVPLPLEIERVTLALCDHAGEWTELASQGSSGYAPYAAIFGVSLTAAQQAQVLAALGGRSGLLTITYHGTVQLPDGTSQPVTGVTDVASWFPAGKGLEHVQMVGGG